MSVFSLFDIGKTAIYSSRSGLDVTSQNISNVNTEGYSRQEIIYAPMDPTRTSVGFFGRGVQVKNIVRHIDTFLEGQIRNQNQNIGEATVLNEGLGQLEEIFNEQKGFGLADRLDDFFKAWQEVSDNPQTMSQRTVLLQNTGRLVTAVSKQTETRAREVLQAKNKEIPTVISKINKLTREISDLNKKIVESEGLSEKEANDLRDKLTLMLNELSEQIDIQTLYDKSGRIIVIAGQKTLINGDIVNKVDSRMVAEDEFRVTIDDTDVTTRLKGGRLAGLLKFNDLINNHVLRDLRKLVASLTIKTNAMHRKGYGLDGSTGNDFFNPIEVGVKDYSKGANIIDAKITDRENMPLHEYMVRFTSNTEYEIYDKDDDKVIGNGTYKAGETIAFNGIELKMVNGEGEKGPRQGDSFLVSPLLNAVRNFGVLINEPEKIAASNNPQGVPGNNENALQMLNMFNGEIDDLKGARYHDAYSALIVKVGRLAGEAKGSQKFEENLLSEMKQRRESVSGVSLDDEAANMIRFQKAFEAAARMLTTTDRILDALLSIQR